MGGGWVGLWPDDALRSSPPSLIHNHNPSPAYRSKEAVGNTDHSPAQFRVFFAVFPSKSFLKIGFLFLPFCLSFLVPQACQVCPRNPAPIGCGAGLRDSASVASLPDMVALLYRPQLPRWKCLGQQMSQDWMFSLAPWNSDQNLLSLNLDQLQAVKIVTRFPSAYIRSL